MCWFVRFSVTVCGIEGGSVALLYQLRKTSVLCMICVTGFRFERVY